MNVFHYWKTFIYLVKNFLNYCNLSNKDKIMPSQEGSCERYARALLPYLG